MNEYTAKIVKKVGAEKQEIGSIIKDVDRMLREFFGEEYKQSYSYMKEFLKDDAHMLALQAYKDGHVAKAKMIARQIRAKQKKEREARNLWQREKGYRLYTTIKRSQVSSSLVPSGL